MPSLRERIGRFFAVDDPWERQGRLDRGDLVVGLVTLVLSALSLELTRSAGVLKDVGRPAWAQWLAIVLGAGVLVLRRQWPLTVTLFAAAHMFVVGVTMPVVMGQLSMQIVYFAAIYSGVAWARSRRDMLVVVGGVVVFMFAWLAWQFSLGSGVDEIRRSMGEDVDRSFGPVSPIAAALLISALVNVIYFGGAVLVGQVAWRGARQRARLAEQAELLQTQSEQLRRRAVLAERLRIARELHDVVAHHVSVIGINAAAARRVLERDPTAAGTALGHIEESSREAVTQMRGLLGTLRSPDDPAVPGADLTEAAAGGRPGTGSRAPEPGLADLPALVDGFDSGGLTATYRLVEEPAGAAAQVPASVALTVYRTAQEALANVRRHSTAARATVVVRVLRRPVGGQPEVGGHVEIEVTDDGRPRHGTSGSGLGQLGIRERAAPHRGVVEIGPRVGGGYRVRVRLPLGSSASPAQDAGTGPVHPRDLIDLGAGGASRADRSGRR